MKEPEESKAEASAVTVRARRERGKLAQRAFRQRQIDTIRNLEDENKRLRDAILAISDAAGQDEKLSLAIWNARKAAGLPFTEVDSQLPAAAGINSDDSGWSSSDSNDGIANITPALPLDDEIWGFLTPSFDNSNELNENWAQPLPDSNLEISAAPLPESDVLDTGVDMTMLSSMQDSIGAPGSWFELDKAIHYTTPPADIIPYLGIGAYTFAGQIFWSSMAFGFQAIRAIVSSPSPPPAAVSTVTDVFTYTMKRVALPQIMYLMHSRLLFRRYGYAQPPANSSDNERQLWSWALGPNLTTELSACMGAEFQKRGVRRDDFLTPLDVEQQLRSRFRDEYPVFEAALRGQALSEEHIACMRRLMQIMSRQSICFGDGPRWRPEAVDSLVNGWNIGTKPVVVC